MQTEQKKSKINQQSMSLPKIRLSESFKRRTKDSKKKWPKVVMVVLEMTLKLQKNYAWPKSKWKQIQNRWQRWKNLGNNVFRKLIIKNRLQKSLRKKRWRQEIQEGLNC